MKFNRKVKKVKKLSMMFVVLFALSFPAAVMAQEEEPVVFVFTTKALNMYMGTDGAPFYDGPVSQSDLFVLFPNGIYVDVWGSVGLDNFNPWNGFDDEVDVTFGWQTKVKGVSLDVGMSYFAIVDGGADLKDLFNPYVGFSWAAFEEKSRFNLAPYLKFEHYRPWSGDALHQGWQNRGGSDWSFKVNDWLSISSRTGIFYDTGCFGFDRGWLSEIHGNLAIALNDSVAVTPMFKWIRPIKGMSVREGTVAYGISISKTWKR